MLVRRHQLRPRQVNGASGARCRGSRRCRGRSPRWQRTAHRRGTDRLRGSMSRDTITTSELAGSPETTPPTSGGAIARRARIALNAARCSGVRALMASRIRLRWGPSSPPGTTIQRGGVTPCPTPPPGSTRVSRSHSSRSRSVQWNGAPITSAAPVPRPSRATCRSFPVASRPRSAALRGRGTGGRRRG